MIIKSKNIIIILMLFCISLIQAQKKEFNTWSVGAGASNFIMYGDLNTFGGGQSSFDYGFYAYVDKMITPAFGFELKGHYLNMSGAVGSVSPFYLLYTDDFKGPVKYDGKAFGGELNLIVNLNSLNPNVRKNRKWNVAFYAGIGYQSYDSKLYDKTTGNLLVDFGNIGGKSKNQNSIYYTSGLGIKYRLSRRVDLEFRPTLNLNNEDQLDAAYSNRKNLEIFLVTHLGVNIKLGSKKKYAIWYDKFSGKSDDEEEKDKKNKEEKLEEELKDGIEEALKDTDGDGIIDRFDKDNNTPPGVKVYSNGLPIDSDNDGIPDYLDKCPLKKGSEADGGCPDIADDDGDGISNEKDICPNAPGLPENGGCPKKEYSQSVSQILYALSKDIFFEPNSHVIKGTSFSVLDKIAEVMNQFPATQFNIDGHTDNKLSAKHNLFLSIRRAKSVKRYLVKQGVVAERLITHGYGETRPRYSNETQGGRQLNRRVEITKVDSDIVTNTTEENIDGGEVIEETTEVATEVTLEPGEILVKDGDTLYSLSKKYNTTVEKLKEMNNLEDDRINEGQILRVEEE
ncbi:OmpA family protein [Aureivirga sp. CE67]|uniref:OmpA family protein n=1 Tax=Aureivirga sp. CE67 TaxID=1788983 RepID=UPI0018C8DDAD|nr:OmpA family protein [Aureivirga sp. CE67]